MAQGEGKMILTREKRLNRIAIGFSLVVFMLLGMMRRTKIDTDIDFSFLPQVNAIINTIVAFSLIVAVILIRQKKTEAHRRVMFFALAMSGIFLLLYVLYHFTTPETKYGGEGPWRSVYYFVLATHVVLAGGVMPFVLFTLTRALTGSYERHRRLARWVFPIWLYVAFTGPIVYLMLRPYY